MKTKAVRLYGKKDLRMEEIDLPAPGPDEILVKLVCDSLCMSSYKAVIEGTEHKRIPDNIAENPIIIGHEFGGYILEVGERWKHKYREGEKFSIQPAINSPSGPVGLMSAPGYSYPHIGGNSQYAIVPKEVLENDCLLQFEGDAYYKASLAEPLSCVIGTMHAHYHRPQGSYVHQMDIRPGGNMIFLAGAGPMGLAALSYALLREDVKPKVLVVTDIDPIRLARAAQIFTVEQALSKGITLKYVNTIELKDPIPALKALVPESAYDDVIVFAPIAPLVELGDALLANDGCLNFFAGPADSKFQAKINFYQVHYGCTHLVGTTGGNAQDMKEALHWMKSGLDPAFLITHIGGLNAVVETTLNLPNITGGKKLIYNDIQLDLTAIDDFETLGRTNPLFRELHKLCAKHGNLWNSEAEAYLLKNAQKI